MSANGDERREELGGSDSGEDGWQNGLKGEPGLRFL